MARGFSKTSLIGRKIHDYVNFGLNQAPASIFPGVALKRGERVAKSRVGKWLIINPFPES